MKALWDLLAFWFASHWKLLSAWLASLTLTQFQAGLGILSTLAVLVYTLFNTYYLIRNNGKKR